MPERAANTKALPRKQPRSGYGSRTEIGSVRKDNEDSLIVTGPLYAVADGMGGHAAGEIASEIAIRALVEHAPTNADAEALGQAVVEANRAVMQAVLEGRGEPGMGTTMTAAILEDEHLVIAHVGDSRAYLLHQGSLQQITRDHSLMADMIEAGQLTSLEARYHPKRSVITRALGSDPRMQADLYEINIKAGDRLLLCTDGLSSMVSKELIEERLLNIVDPQLCADKLTTEAIAAGGYDNITVIVIDVPGSSEIKQKIFVRKTRLLVISLIFALLVMVAAAIGGFYSYAMSSYYLADNEGRVAIYQGLPGSLFGIQVSKLHYTSEIEVSSLQPGLANRLQEGIRVESLQKAESLLNEYRRQTGEGAFANSNTPKGEDPATGVLGEDPPGSP
ncbi:MAG: Stp1/IreP family PP2C-type Ser/Thr phosphatase [Eggerthellaceae bacterium]|nr:Stp1/IreP family PP2C-type Ser/Thr phosphatase [Eggerthellaceae bacterium]